ncbi:cyclic phosphodiesterase-like isoform X2 [Primulina eburnea]|uniref:cyclic phosphodiesterase-like isoform X2 n=1 Tax=Primulina eburnea TaxID=1245227 RepID=UPI003C6C302F
MDKVEFVEGKVDWKGNTHDQNPIFKTCSALESPIIFTSVDPSPFLKLSGSLFEFPISMEVKKDFYSVWALPTEELRPRLKKLMEGLRSEFGGPQFEPHVTVVGAVSWTESEARDRFTKACERLESYDARVDRVATGTFFYQCVFLLLHPTPQVVGASAHCCGCFGYKNSTPYMPHLSLLYGNKTGEEKKTACEKAYVLDENIGSLSFKITHLALYKTDTEDKSCKSWEKVAECELRTC